MKTKLNIIRILTLAAVAVLTFTGTVTRAEDDHLKMKGAQHLQHLNTADQAKDLKTGDTVAMVCSMCKNVAVTRVDKQRGREFLTPGTKHECPMCGGTVTTTGQRIDKKDVITHSCSKCGGESAFCCATKPGEGKTKGMDK
ncbi:MAG TPA: hypothetical protein VMF06_13890 [Candidatus Limnocylindria bacterium]|jgi:tRNA(Ile2) C34 agmatinyltransferase TiaS|nr:hypothetical protein [Candidatus Limnocylindria bacterium]